MQVRYDRTRAAFLLAGLAVPLAVGCRAAFSDPVEPYTAARPKVQVLLEGMNAHLLTNLVASRLIVEVDWVAGLAPNPEALAALEATLRHACAAGKAIEVRVDDEIPRAEWDAVPGDFLAKGSVLGVRLDADPAAWDEADVVHLVYVPGEPELLGWTTTLVVERNGEPQPVTTMFLFAESIRREAELWVTAKKVERAILVHEAGHVLGLVSHPDHTAEGDPGHCTRAGCVMQRHGTRAQLYGALPALFAGKIPDEYCELCAADIARARERWAERAAAEPDLAEQLRVRRRVADLRHRACWYASRQRWAEALRDLGLARGLAHAPAGAEDVGATGTIELELLCPAPSRGAGHPSTDERTSKRRTAR